MGLLYLYLYVVCLNEYADTRFQGTLTSSDKVIQLMENGGKRILELQVWNRNSYLHATPSPFNFNTLRTGDADLRF